MIRLFKAVCNSISMYDCESWLLREALIEKLDVFERTCYGNMLDIKQSWEQVTNKSLYQLTGQVPIRETIRERQLKFTGHYIHMPTDELANCFVIYESKIRSSLRSDAPRATYLNQISSQFFSSGEKRRGSSKKRLESKS